MVEWVPPGGLTKPISSEILGSGARLPNQSIRATPFLPHTVQPGDKLKLFDVKGSFRIMFAGVSDNGAGYMKYDATVDSQSNIISAPYIWQIVGALRGIYPSGGIFSNTPTGFPATSFFSGEVTYITAAFSTDSSGNVANESMVIGYPYVYTLAQLTMSVVNVGSSEATVSGYLVTQPFTPYQEE